MTPDLCEKDKKLLRRSIYCEKVTMNLIHSAINDTELYLSKENVDAICYMHIPSPAVESPICIANPEEMRSYHDVLQEYVEEGKSSEDHPEDSAKMDIDPIDEKMH